MVGHARIRNETVAQPLAAILVTDTVHSILFAARPIIIEPEAFKGLVRGNSLVTRNAVAGAQFELVEKPDRFDPRLLFQFPAHGPRREEAPAVPFGEFRSTVGTGREGHQVTVLVNVVQAREARSEYLLTARGLRNDLVRPGDHLVLERGIGEPAPGDARPPAHAVLVASAQHGRKSMVADRFVVGEEGVARQIDVGRLAVPALAVIVVPRKGVEGRVEVGRTTLFGAGIARHRHNQSGDNRPVGLDERIA